MRPFTLALCLSLLAAAALAHPVEGTADGFSSGVWHILHAWDHLVPFAALGLWAAVIGGAALWVLPLTLLAALAGGVALEVAGYALSVPGQAAAMCSVVLGLLTLFFVQPPVFVAALFALAVGLTFGNAHALWQPGALPFAAGFLITALMLSLGGLVFGQLKRISSGEFINRFAGAAAAALGVWFLSGVVG